jgi:hypothetical protein
MRINRAVSGMSVMSDESLRAPLQKDLSMVILGSTDAGILLSAVCLYCNDCEQFEFVDVKVLNSKDMNPEVDYSKESKLPLSGLE